MPPRYHAERKHIVQSLDALLYQLFCLSYFLSPSLFTMLLRLSAQVMCRSPRELFPRFPLGSLLALLVVFNGFSLFHHITQGAVEGGAILLDFVGLAYSPTKVQLLTVDFSILFLQALLTIVSFETSAKSGNDTPDNLLPTSPDSPIPLHTPSPTSSSFFKTYMSRSKASEPPNSAPNYVIDLQLAPLLGRLRSTPPIARSNSQDDLIPLPSTTSWPMPVRMQLLMRARQSQTGRPVGNQGVDTSNPIPGSLGSLERDTS